MSIEDPPVPPNEPVSYPQPRWTLQIHLAGSGTPITITNLPKDYAMAVAADLSLPPKPGADVFYAITTRRNGEGGRVLTDYRLVNRIDVNGIEVIEL